MIQKKTNSLPAQALVEMALLIMVMLIIAMIILDLGRAIYYYSVINNAAREGARYGIVHPSDDAGIENAVRERAVGLDQSILDLDPEPDTTDICVNLDYNNNCSRYSRSIIVSVVYTYTPVTPIIGNFIGNGITLSTSSKMFIEE